MNEQAQINIQSTWYLYIYNLYRTEKVGRRGGGALETKILSMGFKGHSGMIRSRNKYKYMSILSVSK